MNADNFYGRDMALKMECDFISEFIAIPSTLCDFFDGKEDIAQYNFRPSREHLVKDLQKAEKRLKV